MTTRGPACHAEGGGATLGAHATCHRRLEDEFTVDFGGHRVYTTPKEILVVLNEEIHKLPPETPGLRRFQALVPATATQANRVDHSPLVGQGRVARTDHGARGHATRTMKIFTTRFMPAM